MRILLTGAAGGVGARLRKLLPAIYPDLVLSDLRRPDDLSAALASAAAAEAGQSAAALVFDRYVK